MKYNQIKKGFTLVEMMVAIAVFSIVMVTAMSALLNVIDANNKARAIKTAINNISFALEGISKDMRMGTDYACGDGGEPVGDCSSGGNIIKYRSIRADLEANGLKRKFAYYKFDGAQIWSCLQKGTINCSSQDFIPVTSKEVNLTKVVFYVLGVGDETKQPRMIMTISGEAGTKEKIKTTFDLQTSVSQITRVEEITP